MLMRLLMDSCSPVWWDEKLRSCVIWNLITLLPFSSRVHWDAKPRGWTADPGIYRTVRVGIGIVNPCSTSLASRAATWSGNSLADL